MMYFTVGYGLRKDLGVATAPPGLDIIEAVSPLMESTEVTHWSTIGFTLKKARLADYQANDFGMRLCSPKLRKVLQASSNTDERLQWLDSTVNGEPYFVLHLPDTPAVLNLSESVMSAHSVILPVLARSTRGSVFKCREGDTLEIIVSDRVRRSIMLERCTGLDYEEVPVR